MCVNHPFCTLSKGSSSVCILYCLNKPNSFFIYMYIFPVSSPKLNFSGNLYTYMRIPIWKYIHTYWKFGEDYTKVGLLHTLILKFNLFLFSIWKVAKRFASETHILSKSKILCIFLSIHNVCITKYLGTLLGCKVCTYLTIIS